MNKKQNDPRDLAQNWERAVERATDQARTQPELDDQTLNDAVGLHVESGVRGGWTGSCSCQQSCGCTATIDIC